jgi:transposase
MTDARDAVHLARLLRLDELTPVVLLSPAAEAARDLVRAREDVRRDLMGARDRLSKLLLRHGQVYYGGKAWTAKHDAWLRNQRFESSPTQMAFDIGYDTVLTTLARRDRLDQALKLSSNTIPRCGRARSTVRHLRAHWFSPADADQPCDPEPSAQERRSRTTTPPDSAASSLCP